MNKAFLYRASTVVFGSALAFLGISTLRTGNAGISIILLTIGGIGMVLATIYEVTLGTDSSDSVPSDPVVWTMAIGAILALVGVVLQIVG